MAFSIGRFHFFLAFIIILTACSKKSAPVVTHDAHDTDLQSHNASAKIDLEETSSYTCPMHPQIRQPHPGRCPICGMELVLANSGGQDKDGIVISDADRRLIGIRTMMVEPKAVLKKIDVVGSITFDESRLAQISAYVDGRIEELFADYTGMKVKRGDHLAVIYSPRLYEAQVEYLQIARASSAQNKTMLETARQRLIEFGLLPSQVDTLHKRGQAESRTTIFAPRGGTIVQKPVSAGQYFKQGEQLFRIADLSTVWLVLEVFPEDAAIVHYGQKISARVSSHPNRRFEGRVAFIDPTVNSTTRTVSVRVEIPNPEGLLRPGDFAEAHIEAPITARGSQGKIFDPSLAGKWISPMHPQIIQDQPGNCPICGMKLVPAENFGFVRNPTESDEVLAVPRRAVLKVGNEAIVFVEESLGRFNLRRVQLGDVVGEDVVIVSGLEEYETIAVDGAFLLDSQMQLSGQLSLIDMGHAHPSEDMHEGGHQH